MSKPLKTLSPEKRLFVESMLATLTPHAVIAKEVSKKWGVSETTGRQWIKLVYQALAAEAKPQHKDERRAQMRQALCDFYQKSLLARQFSAAISALDKLCKLDGLYAPELVTVAARSLVERDPDKVRDRIRQLGAKLLPELVAGTPGDEPLQ